MITKDSFAGMDIGTKSMTDTNKLDALVKRIKAEGCENKYREHTEHSYVAYEYDDDELRRVIKLCQPYYAQLAKDAIYELYPDFEPTANTILLAIDDAFKEDKGGD